MLCRLTSSLIAQVLPNTNSAAVLQNQKRNTLKQNEYNAKASTKKAFLYRSSGSAVVRPKFGNRQTRVWQLPNLSLAAAKRFNPSKPEFGSCRTWDWQLPSCNQWWSLSHRTSKRTYNKISHQEPEPPPLPVWALLGVDLQDASLHITRWDGFTKMDFMPNPVHFRSCKDPRCGYLAADKWDYCCGKCQYYFETYGFDLGRPKKKHCNDCWRVYV